LSVLRDLQNVSVEESKSTLEFEDFRPDGLGLSRFLRLDGERAFYLGPGCETCGLVFERLGGANSSVSPAEISSQLREGIVALDHELVQKASRVLPTGEYRAGLLEIVPKLVRPGEEKDYFAHEQVELFGVDPFSNLPQNPGTEYYREETRFLGDGRALFEFLVPMFPSNWLDAATLGSFAARLRERAQPTAFAVGLAEVQQPAYWEGNPPVNEHWCLTHFLLDGHHKVFAASKMSQPLTLLSSVSVDHGTASEDQVGRILDELQGQGATL